MFGHGHKNGFAQFRYGYKNGFAQFRYGNKTDLEKLSISGLSSWVVVLSVAASELKAIKLMMQTQIQANSLTNVKDGINIRYLILQFGQLGGVAGW